MNWRKKLGNYLNLQPSKVSMTKCESRSATLFYFESLFVDQEL